MVGIDRQSITLELCSTAQRLYGIADGVTMIDIVPGSPAAQVGLQPRDVITGAAKRAGVMPSGWSSSALAIQDLAKVILTSSGSSITLLVRSAGSVSPLVLTLGLACSPGRPAAAKAHAQTIRGISIGLCFERFIKTIFDHKKKFS